jgi:hypothetical protein
VHADGATRNNKPNSIIRDNTEGARVVIDGVISGERNVIKKEAE